MTLCFSALSLLPIQKESSRFRKSFNHEIGKLVAHPIEGDSPAHRTSNKPIKWEIYVQAGSSSSGPALCWTIAAAAGCLIRKHLRGLQNISVHLPTDMTAASEWSSSHTTHCHIRGEKGRGSRSVPSKWMAVGDISNISTHTISP